MKNTTIAQPGVSKAPFKKGHKVRVNASFVGGRSVSSEQAVEGHYAQIWPVRDGEEFIEKITRVAYRDGKWVVAFASYPGFLFAAKGFVLVKKDEPVSA